MEQPKKKVKIKKEKMIAGEMTGKMYPASVMKKREDDMQKSMNGMKADQRKAMEDKDKKKDSKGKPTYMLTGTLVKKPEAKKFKYELKEVLKKMKKK